MNYYERVQRSINYIESNLKNDICIGFAAKEAYMSLSNYYRMFFSLTGHTVKEYIRKRRLSGASFDLIYTSNTILDIALDYCFTNGDTFARSFKKVTGSNPSLFKKEKKIFKFERINIMEKYYKNDDLDDKYPDIRVLKEIPPMRVAYYCYFGRNPEENAFRVMTKWLKSSGLNIQRDNIRIFGYNNPSPSTPDQVEYGYEVCVTIPKEYTIKDVNIKEKVLPGGQYAIQGVDVIPGGDGLEIIEAWKQFNRWLKDSKYRLASHQWLEEHLNFNDQFEHVSGMDLYLPIELK